MGRTGATAHPSRWQRFDAAVQTAHQPITARQALMKAARHDNLHARQARLDALDAVAAPTALTPDGTATDESPANRKELLRALGDFQFAWRQLGPVEQPVPASAKGALLQRLQTSVERIEAPLREARRAAEAVREQLIVKAESLAGELACNPALRDVAPRVRELQGDWPHHARLLPLARAVGGAL